MKICAIICEFLPDRYFELQVHRKKATQYVIHAYYYLERFRARNVGIHDDGIEHYVDDEHGHRKHEYEY